MIKEVQKRKVGGGKMVNGVGLRSSKYARAETLRRDIKMGAPNHPLQINLKFS